MAQEVLEELEELAELVAPVERCSWAGPVLGEPMEPAALEALMTDLI